MKKWVTVFTLLFIIASVLSGEESWKGNAAVIRGGSLDHAGLYAVSNSFSKYSKIVVKNLKNGKEAAITVVGRIPETSNMFLLLSREAAGLLGMSENDIIRVTVKLSSEPGTVTEGMPGDLAYNPDPDINPAVMVPEEKAEERQPVKEKPEVKPAEETAKTTVKETEVKKTVPEVKPAPETVKTAVKVPETKKPKAGDENADILKYLAERGFKKTPFKKPHSEEALTLLEKPRSPSKEKAVISLNTEPESENIKKQVQISDVLGRPSVPENGNPSLELPGVETPGVETPVKQKLPVKEYTEAALKETPEEPVAAGKPEEKKNIKPSASTAILKPGTVRLVLEPTEPKPPPSSAGSKSVKQSKAEVKKEPEKAVKQAENKSIYKALSTKELPKKSYYLQLGAYSSLVLAEKLVRELKGSYPVMVLYWKGGKHIIYKVLIGPLNEDESGTLLFRFRARGFKGSFIRYTD